MKKVLLAVPLMAVIVLSYALGRHQASRQTNDGGNQRRVLYWVDPMHPAYKSDKPGTAPDCGMKLEPVYADQESASSATASTPDMPAGTVNIDSAKQQLIGVRVVPVEMGGGAQKMRLSGKVAADDSRVYRLTSAVQGWVQQTYDQSVGSVVKKDQKLADYYSPDFVTFENGYLAATERGTTPSKEFMRSTQYSADRLRAIGMSEVQIKEIAETRKLPDSIYVVSPVNGIILARNISKGLRFDRQTEFYRIADLSRVWILAEIFENESQYFRPGTMARVTIPGQKKTLMARVSNVLPQVDSAARTLKIRLEAENPGFMLRPDMFVDVEMPVPVPAGLSVPVDALVDSGLVKRVYVDRGNGYFEPRTVETGWSFGDRVQITKGLQDGDRVVSGGTFLVDSESRLKNVAAEMKPAAAESAHGKMAQATAAKGDTAKDPTCGMSVDPVEAAAQGNTATRDGKTVYFCSRDCKEKFERGSKSVAANHQHSSTHAMSGAASGTAMESHD